MHQTCLKLLNVDSWSTDNVCHWLSGVRSSNELTNDYISAFKSKNINGKKLTVLDFTDLNELISVDSANTNLVDQITIYKSIQNLIKIKHDLGQETLSGLIYSIRNRITTLLNYLERVKKCSCVHKECKYCSNVKSDIIKSSPYLATAHRKLISWLARLPFTRLKAFDSFRDEMVAEMKNLFKIFRKRNNEQFFTQLIQMLNKINDICTKMISYCDSSCDEDNGKISVAFNYCYLEKVTIRKREPDQLLGISITCLIDGVFTVAEIIRESAADECSKLNVGDDIIAINEQLVVGWDTQSLTYLLQSSYEAGSFHLTLRKMPRENTGTIKQQKSKRFNQSSNLSKKQSIGANNMQRKHSFSDVFLTDQEIVDSSDESEEEEDEDEEDEDDDEDEEDEIDDDEEEEEEENEDDDSEFEDLTGSQSIGQFDTFKNKLKSKFKLTVFSNKKGPNSKRLNEKQFDENDKTNDADFDKQAKSRKIKERTPTGRRRKLSIGQIFPTMKVNSKRLNNKESNEQQIAANKSSTLTSQSSKSTNQDNNSLKPTNNNNQKNNLLGLFERSRSNSTDDNSDNNIESDAKDNNNNNSSNNNFKRNALMNKSHSKTDIIKQIFNSKRWDFSHSKKLSESTNLINLPDTPSLLNNKKQDSASKSSLKNTNSSSTDCLNNNSHHLGKLNNESNSFCNISEQSSMNNDDLKPVSSKPPINKQRNKPKPLVQGWLYKRKQPPPTGLNEEENDGSLTLNSSYLNHSHSGSNSPHTLIRTRLNKHQKWHHYWCVLMKDYIAFYKHPDDKTPKDYILLKNFYLTPSTHNNGFIINDKIKQCKHEFYAKTNEEFKEWYQNIFEIRIKQTTIINDLNSASATSLNSLNETSNQVKTRDNGNGSHGRKNNLQLQLSTIIDSNDDLSSQNKQTNSQNSPNRVYSTPIPLNPLGLQLINDTASNNNKTMASSLSPNALKSPSFQQAFYNSSRESSPGISNNSKFASRDSSPGLVYNFKMEQDNGFTTSESDADLYSKVMMSDKLAKDLMKQKIKNKVSSSVNADSSHLSNNDLSTNKKQTSCSPESSTQRKLKFTFDDNQNDPLMHHRCSSLPGSLHSCIGSYINLQNQVTRQPTINDDDQDDRQSRSANTTITDYSQMTASATTNPNKNEQNQVSTFNLTTQLNKNNPSATQQIKYSPNQIKVFTVGSHSMTNSGNNNQLDSVASSYSPLSSPSITKSNTSSPTQKQQQINIVQPPSSTSPNNKNGMNNSSIIQTAANNNANYIYSASQTNQPAARRISVQVGPNGIKQINSFNISSASMGLKTPLTSSIIPATNSYSNNSFSTSNYSDQQQEEPSTYVTSFAKANLKTPAQPNNQHLYRTELTITPTRKPGNNSPIIVPSPHIAKFLKDNNEPKRNQ